MNLIELLIGLFIGVMIRRIQRLVVVGLLLLNTYFILKTNHTGLHILSYSEWSVENLFNGVTYWVEGLVWFLLCGLFFYVLMPMLLRKLFYSKVKPFMRWARKNDRKNIKKSLLQTYGFAFKFFHNYSPYIPSWSTNAQSKDIGDENLIERVLFVLVVILHFSFVCILFSILNIYYIIALILFSIFHIIILPIVYLYFDIIQEISEEYPRVRL